MERFGEKLRILRERQGLSTRQLASDLEIKSPGYVSKLETGRQKPSIELLLKISLYFGVSTDQLLRDDLELE
jgi:transcriptional regulator with XRE-family HTH domain